MHMLFSLFRLHCVQTERTEKNTERRKHGFPKE